MYFRHRDLYVYIVINQMRTGSLLPFRGNSFSLAVATCVLIFCLHILCYCCVPKPNILRKLCKNEAFNFKIAID